MGWLFRNSYFSDITFEVEGQKIAAHKCILSARYAQPTTNIFIYIHIYSLSNSFLSFSISSVTLSNRSEYFRSLFLIPMKESQSPVVRVDDCDFLTFSGLIEYIYTNKVAVLNVDHVSRSITAHLRMNILV